MIDWNQRAKQLAQIAFEEAFSNRIEVESLVAEQAVYFLNNLCAKEDLTNRDKSVEELQKRLMAYDISVLGYAEYPERGAKEGYSFAMLFDASPEKEEIIRDMVGELF